MLIMPTTTNGNYVMEVLMITTKGNHIIIYKYIKLIFCIPEIYTMLCVKYKNYRLPWDNNEAMHFQTIWMPKSVLMKDIRTPETQATFNSFVLSSRVRFQFSHRSSFWLLSCCKEITGLITTEVTQRFLFKLSIKSGLPESAIVFSEVGTELIN